jgi:uncharacterized SAM-binding protein YcdF (DUF218 family)
MLTALLVLAVVFRNSGSFLVLDNREKSDAIVITQGDELDAAYWMGLHLLGEGYGRELLLDARANRIYFGRSQADQATEFIKKTAGGLSDRVKVCPIWADTTAEEVYDANKCIERDSVRSVLLLSDDFHTRRSHAIFSRLLPQYHWSVAPVPDAARFDKQWWRRREWIRTAVVEWQHMLWWEIVDRWRFTPVTAGSPR